MTALINRKTRHIGGVEFRNPRKFQLLSVTVANSAMEGWQPTDEQIRALADAYDHPQPELAAALAGSGCQAGVSSGFFISKRHLEK